MFKEAFATVVVFMLPSVDQLKEIFYEKFSKEVNREKSCS